MSDPGKQYWLDDPRNVTKVFYALVTLCVLLLSSDLFWYGAGDPVSFTTDPVRMFNTLFSTGGLSEAEQQALRTRRTRVLDAVRANFGSFRRTLEHKETYQVRIVLAAKEKRTLLIAKKQKTK